MALVPRFTPNRYCRESKRDLFVNTWYMGIRRTLCYNTDTGHKVWWTPQVYCMYCMTRNSSCASVIWYATRVLTSLFFDAALCRTSSAVGFARPIV